MAIFVTILLVLAFVLFLIDTIGVPSPPYIKLSSAGLACATLAYILAGHLS